MRIDTAIERVSLVDSLPIKKLDLSSTGITHLWAVSDLDMEELIIKDIKVDGLEPVEYMDKLKKLVVSKGQFTEKELKLVPSHIEIVQE